MKSASQKTTSKIETSTNITSTMTTTTTQHVSETTDSNLKKIIPHDALTAEQIEEMRQQDQAKHGKTIFYSVSFIA